MVKKRYEGFFWTPLFKLIAEYSTKRKVGVYSVNVALDIIADAKKLLDSRERRILLKSIGWRGFKASTLEELAKEYGISRRKAEEIQKIAAYKLRHYNHLDRLPDKSDIYMYLSSGYEGYSSFPYASTSPK